MRMEVVNRIESVIKELWPSADVSTCLGRRVPRVTSPSAGWTARVGVTGVGEGESPHAQVDVHLYP